ncbi:MAG: DNA polymerase III subunit gamma/tau [Rhodoferax sp.]|nr:DNA polymerase III subunit gamma/tau [Rhodoferax sp.]
MSYLVLARKYRPQNFTEMVGQEHVVQALTNALTQQRLHHAYLFTGTRGVGKTTVSRILAKSLNCQGADGQGGITATPCGVCQACRDIDSGRFVDYTELDAASNRGVDEVQSLLEQAVYKPVQGRFKVFMIDEVHMLTNTAFNAMLKTLEEPPEYLKFVLATTDPQKVPATVLSRCLQFNLRPMAPETVLEHLVHVLAQEGVPAQPQALRLLARAARGSMRDALSLTDQAIAFGNGQLEEPTVRLMLGSVDRSYVFQLLHALALGDGKTIVETAEVLRLNGLSGASTLEDMSAVLQRMAVLQAVPAMAVATDASDPDAGEIARLAALMPADETQLLYSICLHGRGELGLAPDEYAALTMVLLRLLAFKPEGQAAEKKTLKRPEAGIASASAEGAGAPAVVSALAPAPASPERAPELAPTPVPPRVPEPASEPAPATAPVPVPPRVPQAPVNFEQKKPLTPVHKSLEAIENIAKAAPEPARAVSSPVPAVVTAQPQADEAATALAGTRAPGPFVPGSVPAAPLAGPVPAAPAVASPAGAELSGLPLQAASATGPMVLGNTPTPEDDAWHAVVQALVASDAITALVRELALQSQLVAREAGHWLLRVERESLNQPTARERLRAALEAAGHVQTISIEIGPVLDSPARRNAVAEKERQRLAQETVMNDPFVQAMVAAHDARIVPGSIKPL